MEQVVSFPGLGIGEFFLNRTAFTIFGMPIYWYGIIIASGFLLAILYAIKRAPTFGLDPDRVMDVILGGVIGGIVGARIYYVAFSWDMYRDNLLNIFNTREGGIAIYGGVIGGFLAGALMCRLRRVRMLPMADLAVGCIILGQGIGRWGNFVNVEAFGSVTDVPWRMCSPSAANYLLGQGMIDQQTAARIVDGTLGVHPTFFYESVWCLLGFALLAWLTSRRRFDGQLTLVYACWYGAERALVEGLRTDSLMWGSVRVSQALAAVLTVLSIALLLYFWSKIKKADDPEYLKLYVNTDEGQAVVKGAFYPKKGGVKEPADADPQAGAPMEPAESPEDGAQEAQAAASSGDSSQAGAPEEEKEEEQADESKAD